MNDRYLRLPSQHMGRKVHMWTFGWWGTPVLVFPSASGVAHEWRAAGAIEALTPLLAAGKIKLYCPEANSVESFRAEGPGAQRMARHLAYERFIVDELVPWIRLDCRTPQIPITAVGISLGALYAANIALKHPEIFPRALCLSGRYDAASFFDGWYDESLYLSAPLNYVPNLSGAALARTRRTELTLVCGQGDFENNCLRETTALSNALQERHIRHVRDIWGHDVSHHWDWWRRQLRVHLAAG